MCAESNNLVQFNPPQTLHINFPIHIVPHANFIEICFCMLSVFLESKHFDSCRMFQEAKVIYGLTGNLWEFMSLLTLGWHSVPGTLFIKVTSMTDRPYLGSVLS